MARILVLLLGFTGPAAGEPPAAGDPGALAARLAALGPRLPGTPAHPRARELLLAAMARSGLEEVEAVPAGDGGTLFNLTGILPGVGEAAEGGGEILLSAHYDTAPGSPGALDDASGCAAVLAAVADLARTPLAHTVRVVLFDGEERDLAGSRAWLAGLSPQERDRVLAHVNLEMVGAAGEGEARPVIATLPVRGLDGERSLAPGWLAHALLRGTAAAGHRARFLGPGPLGGTAVLPQLVLRAARPVLASDADPFLAAGIPAAVLTGDPLWRLHPARHTAGDTAALLDPERLAAWGGIAAAVTRRLDALAGRPLGEDEYLVLAGRVWLRRDLLWLGLLLWAVGVFRGLPGRWRGADAAARRRQRRAYLPGYAFRGLFLLALLLAPVFAAVLLYPAGVLSLARPRSPRWRFALRALGPVPAVAFLAACALAAARGLVAGWSPPPAAAVLVSLTLAAYWMALGPPAPGAPDPGGGPEMS